MGYLAMQFNFVVETNTRAIALWEDLGFETVGRLPRAFRHPVAGLVDARIMYKWLGD
jgi:ribosomal protein S18 acetylase RimI-like enzyme